MSVLLLTLLLATVFAGNYTLVTSYPSGSNCAGASNGFVATATSPTSGCTPSPCVCDSTGGGGNCAKTECNVVNVPSDPADSIGIGFYTGTQCQNEPSTYAASVAGQCINTTSASPSSQIFTCSGGFRTRTWNNGACTGNPATDETFPFSGSTCVRTGNASSIFIKCNSVCFHKDTTVGYKGKQLNLNQLEASEECVIPHRVVSDGVKVTTTCPGVLRLTHKHLVMTPAGWTAAGDLKKGDSLYSKIGDETADCKITSIETERKQEYFGLNCLNSEVLADGYWVSTFGNKHQLPATWMKYAGSVLGIKRASAWGDSIVTLLENWNIVSK